MTKKNGTIDLDAERRKRGRLRAAIEDAKKAEPEKYPGGGDVGAIEDELRERLDTGAASSKWVRGVRLVKVEARLDPRLVTRLDEYRLAFNRRHGLLLNRSDVLRALLVRGLDVAEAEL